MTSHHERNHYRARWMLFKHLVIELLVFSLTEKSFAIWKIFDENPELFAYPA